jgi:hypothetical protein
MPRLSVWFVRTALVYLTLGFTVGALLLAHKGIPLHPLTWRLLPAHIEFLLIGWTVQLVFGVAFWILPRWRTLRGDERPAWLAFVLLNLGVWLVVLASWLDVAGWLLSLGRMLEAIAVGAFALHAWPRVKPWVEETPSAAPPR